MTPPPDPSPAGSPDIATDQSTTLVPLEAWAFQSPHLAHLGLRTDLGGVAEALIYYDRVLLNVQSPQELTDLFSMFARAGQLNALTGMLQDRTIRLCHFAFVNDPWRRIGSDGKPYGPMFLLSAQTSEQAAPGWLDRGLLSALPLEQWYSRGRRRGAVLRAIREGAIKVKANEFGAAVRAAEEDFRDGRRAALFVQALMDDTYEDLGLKTPPEVKVTQDKSESQIITTWNVNLRDIGIRIGHPNLTGATVLSAAANANRLLWMAARYRSDLFAGSPMSQLLGDKLKEASSTQDKPQQIIQNLEASVEFPDVRKLVNEGQLPASEVMRLRSRAGRFRRWLQTESVHDRDALIAYHHEVAKEAGFTRLSRKTLRLFGVLGAGVVGTAATGVVQHSTGDAALAAKAGLVAAAFGKQLLDQLSRAGEEWKPVVFGKWATTHIEKYLRKTGRRR